jgi:RNA polymerase sigma factor (sigma-70 family)
MVRRAGKGVNAAAAAKKSRVRRNGGCTIGHLAPLAIRRAVRAPAPETAMERPKDAMAADPPPAGAEQLGAWIADYGPALRRYFRRRVGPADAEDLVQDVFLAMSTRQGEPVENVEGYLFRIASNLVNKRQGREATRAALEAMLETPEGFSPERILMSKQEAAKVLGAIRGLPPRTRQAFIFHRFEEMTYPEIARRLGVSVSAVKQLIARAIRQVTEERRRQP